MKKLYFFILGLFIGLTGFAQNADGFNYQAIVRDANGNVNANVSMNMKISILQESVDGAVVFTETHAVTTNAFGLVSLSIGSQNPNSFALIDWANAPYFIRININGVEFGTSQLVSVPYALHAKTAENYNETDPFFYSSPLMNVTQSDIDNWANKLDEFTELDPEFLASIAKGISETDIAYWNSKLDEFTETDPIFSASSAKRITAANITNWDNKLGEFTETDPVFLASIAEKITAANIEDWDSKLGEFTELDPEFSASPAGKITNTNIANWDSKLDRFTETDPEFSVSAAKKIEDVDIARWNNLEDGSVLSLSDDDNDTKIQVEEDEKDEDIIRFDMAGTEHFRMNSGRLEVANTGNSIFIGEGAGASDDFKNRRNVAIGDSALYSNTTGNNNTVLGYEAGKEALGLGNIFLGHQAGKDATGDNKLYIDNSDTTAPLIYGDLAADSLHINGHLKVLETI
ncbi:MAG: hypothetical protein GY834_05330 [Bacteroidetes bacterium]|nr:hypothetical protein [Bacteroidota bacterium]